MLLMLLNSTPLANVSGETFKKVVCESCGHGFVYKLTRTVSARATGFALGKKAAQQNALRNVEKKLPKALEQAVDAVPCPHCGQVQTHMFGAARKSYRPWLSKAAVLILVATPLVTAAEIALLAKSMRWQWHYVVASTGIAMVALSLALAILRPLLAWRWNPNSSRETVAKLYEHAKAAGLWTQEEFDAFVRDRKRQEIAALEQFTSGGPPPTRAISSCA